MNPFDLKTKFIILHFEDRNRTEGPMIYEFQDKKSADHKYLELTSNQKEIQEQIVFATVNQVSYLKRFEVEPQKEV